MREILFRGKRIDNGEWIKGFYYQKPNVCAEDGKPVKHYISDLPPFGAEIIPITLCQYTGLKDANGKPVFEGDIVKTKYDRACVLETRILPSYVGVDLRPICTRNNLKCPPPVKDDLFKEENLDVLGNVFDNPELFKEEE